MQGNAGECPTRDLFVASAAPSGADPREIQGVPTDDETAPLRSTSEAVCIYSIYVRSTVLCILIKINHSISSSLNLSNRTNDGRASNSFQWVDRHISTVQRMPTYTQSSSLEPF